MNMSNNISASLMVIFGLWAILALIFFLAFLIRKLNEKTSFLNQNIKVLSNLNINTSARILFLEVEQLKLLIGVTSSGITLLQQFDQKD